MVYGCKITKNMRTDKKSETLFALMMLFDDTTKKNGKNIWYFFFFLLLLHKNSQTHIKTNG
jgi:hypothetical protein